MSSRYLTLARHSKGKETVSNCFTLAHQSIALVRGIFTEACFSKKETVSNCFTLAHQSIALVRGIFTEACFSKKETVK